MPGIFGIISARPEAECQRRLAAMSGCLQHESFYVSDSCLAPDLGVYAGWVALPDSFAAGQPFRNATGDVVLLLAGECFPDESTAATAGGTHWLLAQYERHGPDFVERLNGLFSGLLLDRRTRKAILFNDRYGVERLYFLETSDGFYFASEAKAILRVRPECRAFDHDGVADFLNFGCVAENRTLFRGVSLLPGGSRWTFSGDGCRKESYFTPATWESQPELSATEFETQFQSTFARILPRYFASTKPLGMSLTAGLDTRMVMACRPATANHLVCFTYSGEHVDPLDARLAARIAKVCGLEHHALRIGSDFFRDFASLADRTVYLTDGCFGVSGTHEIYMSRLARQLAPQRLTGNYGGEVLRGVSTFKPGPLAAGLVHPDFQPRLTASAQRAGAWRDHQITFAAFREVPWNLYGNLQAGRSQIGFRTPYLDNELVALAYRAPESLRRSRQTALRLVQRRDAALAAIPTDKADLGGHGGLSALARRAHARITFKLDYLNNEGFPHWLSPLDATYQNTLAALGILGMHKHLHYRSWFRRELAAYVRDAVARAEAASGAFWTPQILRSLDRDHVAGRRNYVIELNAVLTLEAVERLLLRGLSTESDVPASSPALVLA